MFNFDTYQNYWKVYTLLQSSTAFKPIWSDVRSAKKLLKQLLMAQGGQVPCLLSALSEYAWGVFPAVLHRGYRAPWKELRCTPNCFFNSYSSKSKLCDKPCVEGQLWPLALLSFYFSLRRVWNPVESVWNCPGTLRIYLFITQIPVVILAATALQSFVLQDETISMKPAIWN